MAKKIDKTKKANIFIGVDSLIIKHFGHKIYCFNNNKKPYKSQIVIKNIMRPLDTLSKRLFHGISDINKRLSLKFTNTKAPSKKLKSDQQITQSLNGIYLISLVSSMKYRKIPNIA